MGFFEQPRKALNKIQPKVCWDFLRAYLGWSIETYVSKLSNFKMSFYLFIAILCAKMSSVYKP